MKRKAFEYDEGIFGCQHWSYRDLIFVFVILAATGILDRLLPADLRDDLASRNILPAFHFAARGLIVLSTVFLIIRRYGDRPLSVLGLRTHRAGYFVAASLLAVSATVGAVLGAAALIELTYGQAGNLITWPGAPAPGSDLHNLPRLPASYIAVGTLLLVDLMLLMPLMEEVVFRGVAFAPLSRRFGTTGTIIGTAILWTIGHGDQGLPHMISALLLGLLYAAIYARTGSLVPSLTLHISGNSISLTYRMLREFSGAVGLIVPGIIACIFVFLVCLAIVRRSPSSDNSWR